MRQIYLQRQFYQLVKHPPVEMSAEAKERLRMLNAWERLREGGISGEVGAEVLGLSRASLYRWRSRLQRQGLKGLENQSRRPRHCREPVWGTKEAELIRELRQLYPRWGKEKLAVLAQREGVKLSVSTVGRILTYLKQRGSIAEPVQKRWFYSKRRLKRPYAVRKPKDYQVFQPGDLVQVDTLDLHPLPGLHLKHFTARDVISRWDVLEVYPSATAEHARQFLTTVLARMPFPVRAIQVDGGSEFMQQFETACADLDVRLFVLPPRSPKLNGRVERAHRTHLDEFYAVYPLEYQPLALNPVLREWERIYNHVRPHRALDNLSPSEYIQLHYPSVDPRLSHMS